MVVELNQPIAVGKGMRFAKKEFSKKSLLNSVITNNDSDNKDRAF